MTNHWDLLLFTWYPSLVLSLSLGQKTKKAHDSALGASSFKYWFYLLIAFRLHYSGLSSRLTVLLTHVILNVTVAFCSMCVCVRVCMRACVCMYVCVCEFMCVCALCVCVCVCVCAWIHVCIHACVAKLECILPMNESVKPMLSNRTPCWSLQSWFLNPSPWLLHI